MRRLVKMGQSLETFFMVYIPSFVWANLPGFFPLVKHLPCTAVTDDIGLCPDTSAFCAHQCLVDPAAYCPGPFLPEILPEPSSPCQTSRNVGDRCDQSLTGGVQSMLAVVWLLGLVKFVLLKFFPADQEWLVGMCRSQCSDDTNYSPPPLTELPQHCLYMKILISYFVSDYISYFCTAGGWVGGGSWKIAKCYGGWPQCHSNRQREIKLLLKTDILENFQGR